MLSYPSARKVDQVDTYHGTSVADPYRWMEDLSDPELAPWLQAQLSITSEVLSRIGCRDSFRKRFAALSAPSDGSGVPMWRGGRCFQSRRTAGKKGALYLVDDPLSPDGRLVFEESEDTDVVVADLEPSPDGRLLKWCESVGGSDWRTWRFKDVDSGDVLPDVIDNTKLWSHWLPDSSGLLYTSFPSEQQGATRKTALPVLMLHKLGTPVTDDIVVYSNPDSPAYFIATTSSDGTKLILIGLYEPGSSISWAPIDGPYEFTRVMRSDDQLWLAGTRDDTFYIATTKDAPYGQVVAVDASGSSPVTVVPEGDVPLAMVARSAVVGEAVFVARDYLGRSTITMHPLDGSDPYEIELGVDGRFVNAEILEPVSVAPDGSLWFAVTTSRSPAVVMRHNPASRVTDVVQEVVKSTLEVDAQVAWASSRDQTLVPMTLIRSRASLDDPAPPVIIFGYGGGGDSMFPYDFNPWHIAWMEAGGVVALAHIRGGSELGAHWQSAAARGGKLLAMEDFIGCAEWLVDSSYTKAERICIQGRSSGAMLAAAATVARPDLFACCVAEVGMFDPLRYHHFGLGSLMVAEYGTSDVEEDFHAMYAYSPLHNVKTRTAYPAILMTVHTDDDRVAPGGPYKFAATLQEAQTGPEPILLRLRTGAGHHGGADERSEAEERGDILAFIGHALGLPDC